MRCTVATSLLAARPDRPTAITRAPKTTIMRVSMRSNAQPTTSPPNAAPALSNAYANDMSARNQPNSSSNGFMKTAIVVVIPNDASMPNVAAATTTQRRGTDLSRPALRAIESRLIIRLPRIALLGAFLALARENERGRDRVNDDHQRIFRFFPSQTAFRRRLTRCRPR